MDVKDRELFDLESLASRPTNEHLTYDGGSSPAIQDASTLRQTVKTLGRTHSVNLTRGPTKVDPRAKIPGEFRTLSAHVFDKTDGLALVKGKKEKKNIADLSDLDWHTLSTSEVCLRAGVSDKVGLDGPMATKRLAKNGKNVITPPPKKWARKIFFYIFGGFGSLLFGASIICFISWRPLGDPNPSAANLALAVVLLIVICIQAVFNAWQDYSTGRVMASIFGMLPADILVTRDGNTFKLPAKELVFGDLVKITLGSKVPADVRLIDVSSDLKFDRSILTGESKPISGTVDATDESFLESRNIALQGILCTSGSAVGVCVCLGDRTVFGRIAEQAASERRGRTTLEKEITRFVIIIAALAFTVAAFIVILWAAWLRRDHPEFISVPVLLIDCVSVAVAFIPEGLPICVTLSLTVIAGAMRRSNILCKSLSTVETLGAVNVIASDKTGTLTQNKMAPINIAIGLDQYSVTEARERTLDGEKVGNSIRILAAVAGLCNDSEFDLSDKYTSLENMKINGDATDVGLMRFASSIAPMSELRSQWKEVGKLAFNSKNKFAIKLFRSSSTATTLEPAAASDHFGPADCMFLVKGAPDILLQRCSHMMESTGFVRDLDSETMDRISTIQEGFAKLGQRVLLLAKKIIPSANLDQALLSDATDIEERLTAMNTDLTVVGLISLYDPPREDTEETVRVCRGAGIRFAMVTGDFALTATAIARQVGIITNSLSDIKDISDLPHDKSLDEVPEFNSDKLPGDTLTSIVITGPDIIKMNESQWKQLLTFDEIVFARTSPQQKLQIVRTFQAAGGTVAVTGDGVNDAPALKQADIGVAMGGGSEVAMEAADLILLSNFSAIVTGIEYGRLCFTNLRKSILYLLPAGSFSELMPVLLNVLFGLPQALSSIQMIIICVATDVLPALSLVNEKPESDLLTQKPRNRKKDHLAGLRLLGHAYFFIGVLESLTAMAGAFYFGFQRNGVPFSALWLKYGGYDVDPAIIAELTNKAQSIYFFNLVIMQWFNLLATRTRRLSLFQQNPLGSPKTRNIYLFPAMLMALAIGCFFSYVPFFQRVFLTRGVKAEYFFLPMAYGIIVLATDEGRKWWIRGHPKSRLARIAW